MAASFQHARPTFRLRYSINSIRLCLFQPHRHLTSNARWTGANGSNRSATEITKSDVDESGQQHNSVDKGTLKEPSEPRAPLVKSNSFAEDLTKSSAVEPVSEMSSIQLLNDSVQKHRATSSPANSLKVTYVSNLHPFVTEENVVNHLLRNKVG